MGCMDKFIADQIPAIENLIIQYQNALLAFADGVQTYTIDDGQSKTSVSKAQMGEIKNSLQALYQQLELMYQRAGCDSGASVVQPTW